MQVAVRVLAFLGAVLIAFTVQLFAPDTATGRAMGFVAFGIAMYPVVRVWLLPALPNWRYWTGLLVGTTIGWSLDLWAERLSATTNRTIALVVFLLATVCLLVAGWRTVRQNGNG